MANPLVWDAVGERFFETGVDKGVLYVPNGSGVYDTGFAWNGLVSVSESPSGAEPSPQYADNIKYLNLTSVEEFNGTIEAFTYPPEFEQFNGMAELAAGVKVGQQSRGTFGLAYRTMIGNDVDGNSHAYKLHLVYGCLASPSDKQYSTINDSPDPITFSWELSTTAVAVAGAEPTAALEVDSRTADPTDLAALEVLLYGDGSVEPKLPTPDEVAALFTP